MEAASAMLPHSAPQQGATIEALPSLSNVSSVLSVGVNSYTDEVWSSLKTCVSEAQLIADEANAHLTANVHILGAEEQDRPAGVVPRQTILNKVRAWVSGLTPGSVHLFFYAGHGHQFDSDYFFVPSDSMSHDEADDVSLSFIQDLIDRRVKGCTVLFFIAACRAGPPWKAGAGAIRSGQKRDRKQNADMRQNYYLEFFGCRPRETVEDMEPEKNGPFARHLAANLSNKRLNVQELLTEVTKAVAAETGNAEGPCLVLNKNFNLSELYLHERGRQTNPYSVGLGSFAQSAHGVHGDGHLQWRKRIDRITIVPNIDKPVLLLITDVGADPVANFVRSGMGPHFVIHKDGRPTQLVDEDLAAWCGNPAYWGRLADVVPDAGFAEIPAGGRVNEVQYYAVSIGLEGDGGKGPFEEKQYETLVPLVQRLVLFYGIRKCDVLALAEVCMPPGKHSSPGRGFDWDRLAREGLTFGPGDLAAAQWHGEEVGDLKALMEEYGYCLGDGGDKQFDARLESFCDRYQRPGGEQSQTSFAVPALRALLALQ